MTQQEHRMHLYLTREVIENRKTKPEIKGIRKSKLEVNGVKFSTRHNTLVWIVILHSKHNIQQNEYWKLDLQTVGLLS